MYYFVLAVFVVGILIIWRFINSPFGMILKSIRENEQRAISLGYSVARYKLGAFVMSAALAGLAGAVKSLVFQFATLTDVAWQMSGEVILMTPAWRHRDADRAAVRRRPGRDTRKLPGDIGISGDDHHRHRVHDLRADLPPRHHWRVLRFASWSEARLRLPPLSRGVT